MNDNSENTRILIVITTADSREEARKIGHSMVERRLAACAQISGPIESHFWWDGKLDRAEEWQCRLKTTVERYAELERAIAEMHSYEVPQIVAVPVRSALKPFEQWVIEETESAAR
jgi:periplasmic divalent cation tolerance protein